MHTSLVQDEQQVRRYWKKKIKEPENIAIETIQNETQREKSKD